MADELSDRQLRAIELMLTGKKMLAIAKELEIRRQTLYAWRTEDAAFIATLNRRRRELWNANRERLRNLVGEALDVLADDLLNGETKTIRQNAAVHILKCAGVYGMPVTPAGPETVKAVLRERKDAESIAELESLMRALGNPIR